MTFDITVFGMDESDLTDREKETLAVHVHEFIQEEFGESPETVGVDGYRE